jgi:AcrR family transcriptional regulator
MAKARTPRNRWIEEGLRALAAGGPEAVRIEPLAKALGVTKGGFYGYFADRRALLDEILDAWETEMIDEAIERVEAGGGGARAKLRRLFDLASSREVRHLAKVDLAVRDWSRRDAAAARRLRRVDTRRVDYMRSLFADFCPGEEEAEARTVVAFSLFVAGPLTAADFGARSRADVVKLALARLLD